jgi:hypothetical protein
MRAFCRLRAALACCWAPPVSGKHFRRAINSRRLMSGDRMAQCCALCHSSRVSQHAEYMTRSGRESGFTGGFFERDVMSVDLATASLGVAPIDLHRRLPNRRDRRTLTASDIRDLANRILPDGKQKVADVATRRKLQAIDRSFRFSPEAVLIFQSRTARPIEYEIQFARLGENH